MNTIDAYARDVVDGRILAGKYHKLACVRHLADRRREGSGYPFRFDLAEAERFFRFSAQLKHYKGKQFAGKPITLTPVQQFRLGSIFGWRRVSDGLRRFTTSYHELPRKSGKTLEAAVVALYVTFFEDEPGAEGYCIATKRQQAKLVWDACKQLVKSSGLKSRVSVMAHNLHREATQQKLEPLGADADSTDGLNPHFICTDEFHAMKTRSLIDVMESATGARLNPHHFQITTAGSDPVSPCGDQHDYACKILDGVLCDDSTEAFFAFIAHADLEDDWQDEKTWQKANPHWGISINPDDMRKLALKAKNMPGAAAEFKQKRLNMWVNTDQPWLSLDGWHKGQSRGAQRWSIEDMLHERCWVGIDLASYLDLMAMVFVFPPTVGRSTWRLWPWVWTPQDTLMDRAHRDRAPYDIWAQQGFVRVSPGTRIDHQLPREVLREQRTRFDIEMIGFDPWHADTLVDQLIKEDGFSETQVVAVPQTFQGMSSACRRFEADVLAGDVDANDDPLMRWCVSNAVVQRDGKDNIYPVKKKSRGRIDPVMATLIAASLYLRQPVESDSVYEDRGVLVF